MKENIAPVGVPSKHLMLLTQLIELVLFQNDVEIGHRSRCLLKKLQELMKDNRPVDVITLNALHIRHRVPIV